MKAWYIFVMILLFVGVVSFVFIIGIVPIITENNLAKFCIEEGYDGVEYSPFVYHTNYCYKIENKTIIKEEIQTCRIDNKLSTCFVKTDQKMKGGIS